MGLYTLISRKIRTALTLSIGDWWILWQAWILLLVFDLRLRRLPFKQVQRLAANEQETHATQADGADETIRCTQPTIGRMQHLVGIAARHHLYPMTCLRQSLALQWLLGRQGITTDLRIGVRKDEDKLNAHAWLEYAGQRIDVQQDEHSFAPLAAWEANR